MHLPLQLPEIADWFIYLSMEEDFGRSPSKIKAWCRKCYMTFENGPKSQMVLNHLAITDCDSFPCNKPLRPGASPCIRRFRCTNSANRHTYCYTNEQVLSWTETLRVETDVMGVEDLMLDSLVLTESPDALLAINSDGGSEGQAIRPSVKPEYKHYALEQKEETLGGDYEIPDDLTITELIDRVKAVLGKEHPRKALSKVRNAYKRLGYTSAGALRIARLNQGSWEFLYRDFADVCPEIVAISHIVKYLLCKRPDSLIR